jgi:hypothetical protein
MKHTVESIRELLRTNDAAVGRALLALNARQTADEQRAEITKYHNNMGFMPAHAKKGTGMARFYERAGFLTPRQLAWWRAVTPKGKMRIEVYAAQLLKVAEAKQAAKEAA